MGQRSRRISDLTGTTGFVETGQVSVADGVVYVVANESMAAFNSSDGARLWTYNFGTFQTGLASL